MWNTGIPTGILDFQKMLLSHVMNTFGDDFLPPTGTSWFTQVCLFILSSIDAIAWWMNTIVVLLANRSQLVSHGQTFIHVGLYWLEMINARVDFWLSYNLVQDFWELQTLWIFAWIWINAYVKVISALAKRSGYVMSRSYTQKTDWSYNSTLM